MAFFLWNNGYARNQRGVAGGGGWTASIDSASIAASNADSCDIYTGGRAGQELDRSERFFLVALIRLPIKRSIPWSSKIGLFKDIAIKKKGEQLEEMGGWWSAVDKLYTHNYSPRKPLRRKKLQRQRSWTCLVLRLGWYISKQPRHWEVFLKRQKWM